MHLAQHVPRRLTVAFVMALAALAFVSNIAFTIDGRSSYVQAPSATMLAVIDEDVVSPLAATSSSVVKITDATTALASKTVTDSGILTASGLLLLAAIGAIYLIENGTGHLRHRRRIWTMATRKPAKYMTFLRSHGGAAYAISIAVLSLVFMGALALTLSRTSIA